MMRRAAKASYLNRFGIASNARRLLANLQELCKEKRVSTQEVLPGLKYGRKTFPFAVRDKTSNSP